MSDSVRGPEVHVTMPDGSVWAVDARIVAREYALYYSESDEGTSYSLEYSQVITNDLALLDFAAGELDWADFAATARLVSMGKVDFQEGWRSGAKKVVRHAIDSASAGM